MVELKEFPTFRFHIFFSLHYSCSYSHLFSLALCAKYIPENVKSNSLVLMPCPSSISIFLVPASHSDVLQITLALFPIIPICLLPFPSLDFSYWHQSHSSFKWGCPFFARLIDKLWYSSLRCSCICFLMIHGLITISPCTQYSQPILLFNIFSFQSKVTS